MSQLQTCSSIIIYSNSFHSSFKAAQSQEAIDLEESVEKRLQDYKNRSRKLPLEGHEKFLDLTEKIAGILNPGMCWQVHVIILKYNLKFYTITPSKWLTWGTCIYSLFWDVFLFTISAKTVSLSFLSLMIVETELNLGVCPLNILRTFRFLSTYCRKLN